MSLKQVNEIVPIVATIECPDDTYFVRATIRDKDDNVLATLNVPEQPDGSFAFYGYLMPDLPLIKIRYEVFEDAAFTTPVEDLCPEDETFERLSISQAQAIRADELVGLINASHLLGFVRYSNSKLIGSINAVSLGGKIGNNSRLFGIIENENIEGTLKGC